MTRDDVIRMAREADPGFEGGADSDGTMTDPIVGIDQFLKFAYLVAAAEREACEKALNELRGSASMFATVKEARAHNNAITCCVEAIRARGDA